MTTPYTFTVTILGKFTFVVTENNLEQENLQVFTGTDWEKCRTTQEAFELCARASEIKYGGSARAQPTGFGFVADAEGNICGYAGRGTVKQVYYQARWEYVDGNPTEFKQEGVMNIKDLGLTRKAIINDQMEMLYALGML